MRLTPPHPTCRRPPPSSTTIATVPTSPSMASTLTLLPISPLSCVRRPGQTKSQTETYNAIVHIPQLVTLQGDDPHRGRLYPHHTQSHLSLTHVHLPSPTSTIIIIINTITTTQITPSH